VTLESCWQLCSVSSPSSSPPQTITSSNTYVTTGKLGHHPRLRLVRLLPERPGRTPLRPLWLARHLRHRLH
jgi:hypothetical protein